MESYYKVERREDSVREEEEAGGGGGQARGGKQTASNGGGGGSTLLFLKAFSGSYRKSPLPCLFRALAGALSCCASPLSKCLGRSLLLEPACV